jgi:hypothetical protein
VNADQPGAYCACKVGHATQSTTGSGQGHEADARTARRHLSLAPFASDRRSGLPTGGFHSCLLRTDQA